MPTTIRSLVILACATALALTGCAREITGTPVLAAGQQAGGQAACATVDAPLADVPAMSPREPQLRIPVPAGWQRNAMMDSQVIRYAIVAEQLIANGFAPNAVVTLERARGVADATEVFEENRANLVRIMNATDLQTEDNTTCGFPSETTTYMAPPMGPAPRRPIIMHAVVAQRGNATYLATVTIQTSDGANPTYQRDAQQIVDGFQLLLP
ncbi:LpqN/LpqT family lipoprotein [Mycobacterium sp. SMC-4]|uniref:LpqN/LpqT family lipoprotein n=1 Tax=Mycobacterium sp. SMC-4 TaxID=2857059 RepID=UPI0021B2EA43|nr:LpqN/LpqT family lipoprotein [Mycobacterium sp. SMC-4]UXA18612.1 LpqN/LpqT family lipoprotein [Mycobacterium sp. SMC-4]